MAVDLLLGLQWGDEDEGKIVDVLTQGYDVIARLQGGPNAGHTPEFNDIEHVLHTIPSGTFHPTSTNIIGNGVVIDPIIFKKGIDGPAPYNVPLKDSLLILRKAHLILLTHRLLDAASEASKGKAEIGSTLKGIGPTYMDKTGRNSLRVSDIELDDFEVRYRNLTDRHEEMLANYKVGIQYNLKELEAGFFEAVRVLKGFQLIDSEEYLYQALKQGKKILAEGAQGSLLGIDFGTYPFITSSNTTAAGACTGLGAVPRSIDEVIGIFKAYTTRVGSGPFPTELFDEAGETITQVGHEFGATTGRRRRCGRLDLVALKYVVQVSGVTQLIMMKADVLSKFDTLKVCTSYLYKGKEIEHLPYNMEEQNVTPVYTELKGWHQNFTDIKDYAQLPKELTDYVDFLERKLEIPIKVVSVGPDRTQTITR